MSTRLLTTIIGLGLLLSCSNTMTGGSTETSSRIAGVLYNSDHTRASHAKVTLVPSGYNPHGSSLSKTLAATSATFDSTFTDDTGAYRFSAIPADTCNILSSHSGNLCFHDSVIIPPDSHCVVPPDSLKAPGSLNGIIQLQGTDNPTTVFILVFGTNVWTAPQDSTGNFSLTNMAEGSYHVRILTTLDAYKPLDTTLKIQAGKIDTLPRPIQLQYTGISVPTGVAIIYDTMKQIVTLSWNKPTVGRAIAGYNIYRKRSDSVAYALIKGIADISDTVYQDSTGVQDETYEYRVAAVDSNNSIGTMSGAAGVTVVGAFTVVDSIVKGYATNVDGNFSEAAKGVVDRSGNFYIIDFTNKWLQKLDPTGKFIFKAASFAMPISIANYSDSFLFICDYSTKKTTKTDLNGIIDTIFSTIGRPSGVCTRNDSIFISSDSGILVYNLNGQQIYALGYSFSLGLSSPNIIAHNNGKLYAIDSRGALEVDLQAQTVRNIWAFNDPYANQQARLCQYNNDTLAIISSGGDAPFFSSLYLVTTIGVMLSKCKLRYGIGGIIKANGLGLIGFSSTGRILFLRKR